MKKLGRVTSSREVSRLMQRLGIKVKGLEGVKRVVVELEDKNLIVKSPFVSMVSYGKVKVLQVEGEIVEEEKKEEIEEIKVSEEDIKLVAEKAGVNLETARRALIEEKGDLASAIIKLRSTNL